MFQRRDMRVLREGSRCGLLAAPTAVTASVIAVRAVIAAAVIRPRLGRDDGAADHSGSGAYSDGVRSGIGIGDILLVACIDAAAISGSAGT